MHIDDLSAWRCLPGQVPRRHPRCECDRGQGKDARPTRSAGWASTLQKALASDPDILFNHQAVLAAVRTIEDEVERGEKVLVFRALHPRDARLGELA